MMAVASVSLSLLFFLLCFNPLEFALSVAYSHDIRKDYKLTTDSDKILTFSLARI